MNSTLTIDEINNLIEQHSGRATDALAQLATYCQQDDKCRTPLNVAIQSHNHEIAELIAKSSEAISFFPKIDEDLLAPVKHTVCETFDEDNIEATEKYLAQSFGPHLCLQRTPLHTACRYANENAIVLLLSNNADLKEKDILGLTPFDLCIQFGGASAIDRFIRCCSDRKRKPGITELALRHVCTDTALYQRLIQSGKLDMKAKRFAFNLACALLDKDNVQHILEQGLDINKTMNHEYSPILEICTSRLLYLCDHPQAPRLAGQYAAAKGPGSAGIQIDNDAILNAESLEDIETLFSASVECATIKHIEQTSHTLSDDERQSQRSQRLDLIEYLFEHDLDSSTAESKAPYGFVSDIVTGNSPELLQALVNKGFSLAPEQGDEDAALHTALSNEHYAMVNPLLQLGHQWGTLNKKHPEWVQAYSDWKKKQASDVSKLEPAQHKRDRADGTRRINAIRNSKWTWELAGESVLLAATQPERLTHNKPAIVRLTHNNVYGPRDDVHFFLRFGDPDVPTAVENLQSGGGWHPMTLVEELLSVDGERVDRSSVSEPVYGEVQWEGTYECELIFKRGKRSIEIRLVSDEDEMSGVISDWIVTVT